MRWQKGLKSPESLKNITKETIVQFCTWDDIDTLPLPNALKDFLQGPPPLEYIDLIDDLDGSITVHNNLCHCGFSCYIRTIREFELIKQMYDTI